MSEVDSFQIRVKNAVKGSYQSSMRRSIQSLALYEADRCLTDRYPSLRPFQRKHALLTTTVDLLKTLDFLNEYHRQEVMFRTNASKEALAPDLAWRRMKLISREVNQTILPKAKELIENDENSGKSHDEICAMLLQTMYEESTENSKPHPPTWEWNHNNVFTVYRVYFRGLALDTNIFPAIPPRVVAVPAKKPANAQQAPRQPEEGGGYASTINFSNMTLSPKGRTSGELSVEERRAMLKEVKDHVELLKDFEGIIPAEELAKRKRALYAALPPVPPPAGGGSGGATKQKKKAKVSASGGVAAAPTKPAATEDEDWEKVGADDKEEEPTMNFASV